MEIKTGYLYHIKDEFFDLVNDDNLMANHERGKKRFIFSYYDKSARKNIIQYLRICDLKSISEIKK